MYFIFLALWIIFNGKFTLEILLFGIVIASVIYWFMCRFIDFSIQKDLLLWKRGLLLLRYFGILILEIIKANVTTMKLLFSEKYEIEPVLITFQTTLETRMARVLLANSITLTPGTITVMNCRCTVSIKHWRMVYLMEFL